VKSFFATPIVKEPGTTFLYNTLATYMVSAIVQKVTGEKVIDYLKPRLFEPLAIEGMDWEVDPQGRNVGGWGLRIKTEDMAKLGQMYLQKGKWNGKQLLPESWIAEATSAVIKDSAPGLAPEQRDSSDWAQGYGYQFWQCRNNAYRADGAYGQYIIVMPEFDAVVVLTSETPDMQDEINLVWKFLLPALQNSTSNASEESYNQLKTKLASLALPLPEKNATSAEETVRNESFVMDENASGYEEIDFAFATGVCKVNLKKHGQSYSLEFGSGEWKLGETAKLGPTLIPAKAHFVGLPNPKVAGVYQWKNENTLELTLRYIESPHAERYLCRFQEGKVFVELTYSNQPGIVIERLSGVAKK
jgi:hypothetical protein